MTKKQLIKLIGLGEKFKEADLAKKTIPQMTEIYNGMLKKGESKVKRFKSKPIALTRLKSMFVERYPDLLDNGQNFVMPTVWCNQKDARIRKEVCQLRYFNSGSKKCILECDYYKNILQPATKKKFKKTTKPKEKQKPKPKIESFEAPDHCKHCPNCVYFLEVSKKKKIKEHSRLFKILKAFKEHKGRLKLSDIEKVLDTKYPRQQMHSLKDHFPLSVTWDKYNKEFVLDQ